MAEPLLHTEDVFHRLMIELAVLTVMIVALVGSVMMLRGKATLTEATPRE